jgi:hypothetical protein
MPLLRTVQRQIQDIEGFRVKFRDRKTNRDVNDNHRGIPGYPYHKALKGICSVSEWKHLRFKECYPGFAVDVLNAGGSIANGKTRLWNVRDTYLE